uniref:RagB/SusD family nutrient uptake outer membrane protein n=1 Tax=Prevotella sp. GTC17260 TaxID=3236796 RepID=A0AB33JG68_9BACT
MKNKIFLGCLLAASALTFQSCGNILDEDPKGQRTPGNFFTTVSDIDQSLYALYEQVNHTQNYTNPGYPQWQGDDITANPGSNKQACAAIDAFNASDNNKGVNDSWRFHYNVIKAANLIIDAAENTTLPADKVNIAVGQARFWRAYAYYYLVRIFGPLPVNLHNENDYSKTELTDVKGIYDIIVSDLEAADKLNLPASYTSEPAHLFGVDVYVTQQAVKSTLAAVYMSMAGTPLNLGQSYYAKAAAKAKEVIDGVNSGKYDATIDSDWKNVYSYGNNYNKETILGINFSPTKNWFTDSEFSSCCLFESLGGWGDAWGEIKFWKKFPDGPRKRAIYDPQIRQKDGSLVDWWALDSQGKAIVPERHPMFSIFTLNADKNGSEVKAPYDYTQRPYEGMCTDTRHQLIRYPEVMLWYAESAARSGGDLTLAKECLKKVRARAVDGSAATKVDGVNIDAMSADQLAKAAFKEHGWEVAGNWVALVPRRSDEFRLNILKDNFEYRKSNAPLAVAEGFTATESVPVTGTWNDNMNYLPYPGSEVEKNPNLKR